MYDTFFLYYLHDVNFQWRRQWNGTNQSCSLLIQIQIMFIRRNNLIYKCLISLNITMLFFCLSVRVRVCTYNKLKWIQSRIQSKYFSQLSSTIYFNFELVWIFSTWKRTCVRCFFFSWVQVNFCYVVWI